MGTIVLGRADLSRYISLLDSAEDFIVEGDFSPRPGDSSYVSFYLRTSADKQVFAIVMGGGLNEDLSESVDEPFREVVAVYDQSGDTSKVDESTIVRELLGAYWDSGGQDIEFIHEEGDFELNTHCLDCGKIQFCCSVCPDCGTDMVVE